MIGVDEVEGFVNPKIRALGTTCSPHIVDERQFPAVGRGRFAAFHRCSDGEVAEGGEEQGDQPQAFSDRPRSKIPDLRVALLAVCEEEGVPCIDLANAVPKEYQYFYDDMHFSEAGADLVASVVAEHLRQFAAEGRLGSLGSQ